MKIKQIQIYYNPDVKQPIVYGLGDDGRLYMHIVKKETEKQEWMDVDDVVQLNKEEVRKDKETNEILIKI